MKLSIRGKRVNHRSKKYRGTYRTTNKRIQCSSYSGGSCEIGQEIYSQDQELSYKKQKLFATTATSMFKIKLEKIDPLYNLTNLVKSQLFKLTMTRISANKTFQIYFLANSANNQREKCTSAKCYTIFYSQNDTQQQYKIFSKLDTNLNNTIKCSTLENIVAANNKNTQYTFNCSDLNKPLFDTLSKRMINCLNAHLTHPGVSLRI